LKWDSEGNIGWEAGFYSIVGISGINKNAMAICGEAEVIHD
jgi:hypothetical protein